MDFNFLYLKSEFFFDANLTLIEKKKIICFAVTEFKCLYKNAKVFDFHSINGANNQILLATSFFLKKKNPQSFRLK